MTMRSLQALTLATLASCATLPAAHAQDTSTTTIDGTPGQQMPGQPPGAPPQQQPSQQMSPQMRADIAAGLSYRLAPDFFPRATETLTALKSSGLQPPNSTGLSLRQTIDQMRAVPGLPPVLRAHGFTPETFVMSMTAFGMTLAATNGQSPPPGMPSPNPANVALFQAHPDQVQTLLQALGTPPQSGTP